jgi:hypothetical protein
VAAEEDHFSLWLRAMMTGCRFAGHLAASSRMAIETFLPPLDPSYLDSTFDRHGASERAVVALLPSIRSEIELVHALNSLPSDRWKLIHRPSTDDGLVFVGVQWSTSQNHICHAMGFAPFITMPVPRRAPYVAIALWPGGRSNSFRGTRPTPPGKDGQVDFLDAAHGLDEADYRKRWDVTTREVKAILDDTKPYRESAFVLPTSVADQIKWTA